MATYYARKAGNINAADVWATTPSGTASNLFPTFTNADVLVSNNFTITINVNTTVAEFRNDTTGGATAGGGFSCSVDLTIKGNLIASASSASNQVLSWTGTGVLNLEGNLTGGLTPAGQFALQMTGGTVNLTGNATAGNNGNAISNTGGFLNMTGQVIGGSRSDQFGAAIRQTAGSMTLTGNVSCPSIGQGITCTGGNITITGNVTGGTASTANAINNGVASNLVIVNGQATGGIQAPAIANTSTGTIRCTRVVSNAYGPGNTAGLTAQPGIANSGLGVIEIEQLEYGTFGMSPTSGTGIRLKKANTNVAVFNFCDTAGAKTLIDATQNAAMPATTDVRSGVSYASGAATGSCAVPAASSVAFGVPVDNTTGTAVLTLANVQSALTEQGLTTARAGALDNLDTTVSSRLSPSGTLATVDTLTNAPSVPSASAIASQVRTELAAELARVDQNISSRLAAADYNAPTSAPTAASVANAVWSAATKEITGGTVTTLTNAPSVPTPAQIASQVRTELATELARVDVATSTRLAGSAYTAPANSDIAAIKSKTDNLPASPAATGDIPSANIAAIKAKTDNLPASPAATGDIPSANIAAIKSKTDLLNTDRLAQVSTVSTTGAQLAAALS